MPQMMLEHNPLDSQIRASGLSNGERTLMDNVKRDLGISLSDSSIKGKLEKYSDSDLEEIKLKATGLLRTGTVRRIAKEILEERKSKKEKELNEKLLKQAEVCVNRGDFLEAADCFKKAGFVQDYNRMLDKHKRKKEEKRVAEEKASAIACEKNGELRAASEHYESAGMIQDSKRVLELLKKRTVNAIFKLMLNQTEETKNIIDTLYAEQPVLMEEFIGVQSECPQLFEGVDVMELFNNKKILEGNINYYKNHKELCKTILNGINKVSAVGYKGYSMETFYNAIPCELRKQLVGIVIPDGKPSTSENDEDILRFYIKEASKSFAEWDFLVLVVKKILKKLLCLPILPIPSVTTAYLFVNWSSMLWCLDYKHYGDKALSKDGIVAVSLSLVAMLLQLINRESPLSYLKTAYSGGVYVKDFIDKMPSDLKKMLVNVFFNNANERTKYKVEDILSYNIVTWNNVLEELTEIPDLSMFKTVDMLYTFRVGTTFLDYVKDGRGLEIHTLSEYWKNHGPLPNNPKQMERLFDLFRIDGRARFSQKHDNVLKKHIPSIISAITYRSFLEKCKRLYEELSLLVVAYKPDSYNVSLLYTLAPKLNVHLVVEISLLSRLSKSNEVNSLSPISVQMDLMKNIQQSLPFLIA